MRNYNYFESDLFIRIKNNIIKVPDDHLYPDQSTMEIIVSKDYGKTWKKTISNPPFDGFNKPQIFSEYNFGCLCRNRRDSMSYYSHTEDGGVTWNSYTIFYNHRFSR